VRAWVKVVLLLVVIVLVVVVVIVVVLLMLVVVVVTVVKVESYSEQSINDSFMLFIPCTIGN